MINARRCMVSNARPVDGVIGHLVARKRTWVEAARFTSCSLRFRPSSFAAAPLKFRRQAKNTLSRRSAMSSAQPASGDKMLPSTGNCVTSFHASQADMI